MINSVVLSALIGIGGWSSRLEAMTTTLTWAQCLAKAVQSNPDLKVAKENLRAADYQRYGAFSGFLPQVSSNFSYNHSGGTVAVASSGVVASTGGGIATTATSGYTAGISGALNVFNGFQDTFKVAQAEANRQAAAYAYAVARAQVSYNLKNAFAGLVYAQNSLQLTEDIIGRREDNLRLVELRFESGRENRGSQLLSQSYLAQAKLDHLTAKNNRLVGIQQFVQILGETDLGDIELVGDVPSHEPGNSPDLPTLALAHPSRLQLKAQEEAATAALRIAFGNFSPEVSLTGSYSRQGNLWFPENERWTVGVSVALPIFNGGQNFFGARSAAASRDSASATARSTALSLLGSLSQAYTNFVQAVETLKVNRQFLEATTVRAEIARGKYNNGLLTFEDWDIIESDLITRQKNVLQSQQSLTVAEASWENAQGKGALP